MSANLGTYSIPDDIMEEYIQLSYLKRSEILCIQKRFWILDSDQLDANPLSRFSFLKALEAFPEFKENPFRDRLFIVFSSLKDGQLSFEDMLDLFSALSANCPDTVKAAWAFKVFDFNDDNSLCLVDIETMVTKLSAKITDHSTNLSVIETREIALKVLDEIDMDKTGEITKLEFVHAVMKMPDFSGCFSIKP